ncbi:mannose-1-phosphate guanylyltransferase [Aureispira anguillae]|uniref:mannose-1-phosphate guanylyltransferase n=1 Tax=Aureispira anguillae TaxID=2864201 RepID=A0A915YJ48_9BACT|nr:mannose-1-phosphate guanylyltransferase [Aureispira anguillae]BDS13942.1 mannose-1-phosphate guanylyltransferase [Aureispira anguillae]
MNNNNYVVIMAGGIGSRFWPSSRKKKPKQFLDILGLGKTLLQLTFERFLDVCPVSNIFIVTNMEYKKIIQEQLPELTDQQILTEPSRNDTAPCITYAAMKIRTINPNANFVVAPSDHIILKEEEFIKKIKTGLDFVHQNKALLTLGIQPNNPNTGYGYIHFDPNSPSPIYKVHQFTEKPNLENAKKFVASGDYLWNAGIFIWNVNTVLDAIKEHANAVYEILNQGEKAWCTDQEQAFLNEYYPTTPSISIDYAIMEKANNIYTLPADIGWSDLGTWGSLHEQFNKDENNNAISSPTPDLIQAINTSNCMLRATKDKLVVVKDLENYIVVDEDNVLLIYPKNKEQEIKQVSKELAARFGADYL